MPNDICVGHDENHDIPRQHGDNGAHSRQDREGVIFPVEPSQYQVNDQNQQDAYGLASESWKLRGERVANSEIAALVGKKREKSGGIMEAEIAVWRRKELFEVQNNRKNRGQ